MREGNTGRRNRGRRTNNEGQKWRYPDMDRQEGGRGVKPCIKTTRQGWPHDLGGCEFVAWVMWWEWLAILAFLSKKSTKIEKVGKLDSEPSLSTKNSIHLSCSSLGSFAMIFLLKSFELTISRAGSLLCKAETMRRKSTKTCKETPEVIFSQFSSLWR